MNETINLYDTSLQHLSSFFNPIQQRRLMRYVVTVLHLYPHGENPPAEFKFVNLNTVDLNYTLLVEWFIKYGMCQW